MNNERFLVFAFLTYAFLFLASCEQVPATQFDSSSIENETTQFAFNLARPDALKTDVSRSPLLDGRQVNVVLVDATLPTSFERSDSLNLGIVIPCRDSQRCAFDFGRVSYSCFGGRDTHYYCEGLFDSSDIRLTFASDGRFAKSSGGKFEAGVWYDTQEMRQVVMPTYNAMSNFAAENFRQRLSTEERILADRAARVRRENNRRLDAGLAVLTGIAAGVSGQPLTGQSRPSSSAQSSDDNSCCPDELWIDNVRGGGCELGSPGKRTPRCSG